MELNQEKIEEILRNADDLLTDGGILIDNNRLARGFTLIHLGSEETAKGLVMLAAVLGREEKKSLDQGRLRKIILDHRFKIDLVRWFDNLWVDPDLDSIKHNSDESNKMHQLYNNLKNASLYVDLESKAVIPAEIFGGKQEKN